MTETGNSTPSPWYREMAASERPAAMKPPSDLSYSKARTSDSERERERINQRCRQDNAPNHVRPKFQIAKPDQVVRRHSAHRFTRCLAAGHHVCSPAATTASIRFRLPGACSADGRNLASDRCKK